jgi:hypothetical protein
MSFSWRIIVLKLRLRLYSRDKQKGLASTRQQAMLKPAGMIPTASFAKPSFEDRQSIPESRSCPKIE